MYDYLNSSVAAVARLGAQSEIEAVSPAFCRLLGRAEEDLIGRSFLEFAETEATWCDALSSDQASTATDPLTLDFKIAKATDRSKWVRANIQLSVLNDSKSSGYEINLTEIGDLKNRPVLRAHNLEMFERILNVINAFFWVNRLSDGKTTYTSPASVEYFRKFKTVMPRNVEEWTKIIHPDERARVYEEFRKSRAAEIPFALEYRIVLEDETVVWIFHRGYPFRDEEGKFIAYIGVGQEITERKNRDFELARMQAAENIRAIAADLAHNFNNLLAIIDLAAHGIARDNNNDFVIKKTQSIHYAVDRGSDIINTLLAMTSNKIIDPVYADLNEILNETRPLISTLAGPNIQVIYDCTSLPCPLYVDKSGLSQAIINLITNSREAMDEGGEIMIKTRVLPMLAGVETADTPNSSVSISIEDTGMGMTDHVLRHANDPYFTTKSNGRGLGLAITAGFVRQSGGDLSFSNRIGGGLIARMTFPHTVPPTELPAGLSAELEKGAMRQTGAILHAGTILVVDDEPLIAESISEMLVDDGHHVICAASISEAKEYLEDAGYKLVICDIAMGTEETGVDLARWIKEKFPLTALLLTSGYSDNMSLLPNDMAFIKKPYRPNELHAKVRELLK
ncbi:MAG: PAS domain-containing protein [Sphingobium sp.]|nr:MAG: PAS domain-containing protein [Sphingobium sp.]